jgi:hypothetical protein
MRFALPLLLAACALTPPRDDEDDPTGLPGGGQPDPMCTFTESAIDADDASALGFSANDVVAAVAGVRADTLVYNAGGSTALSLELTAAEDLAATLVDGEPIDPGLPPDACADSLRVSLVLDFSSDDGAFAESMAVVAYPTELAAIPVGGDLDLASLGGSFTSPDIGDPSAWDSATLSISATFGAADQEGRLDVSASRDLGGGMGEGVVGPVGAF